MKTRIKDSQVKSIANSKANTVPIHVIEPEWQVWGTDWSKTETSVIKKINMMIFEKERILFIYASSLNRYWSNWYFWIIAAYTSLCSLYICCCTSSWQNSVEPGILPYHLLELFMSLFFICHHPYRRKGFCHIYQDSSTCQSLVHWILWE